MNHQVYPNRPAENEDIRSLGIVTTVVRFNIQHTDQGWECDEVEYSHRENLQESDYGSLVSAIVRGRYSEDDVEAIVNNYLAAPDEGAHTADFQQLQQWRSEAKIRAREIISANTEM